MLSSNQEHFPRKCWKKLMHELCISSINQQLFIRDNLYWCISDFADVNNANDVVTVAGWGYQSEGSGKLSCELMRTDVPVVDYEECARMYTPLYNRTIKDNVICVGYKEGSKDASKVDNGGPLMKLMDDRWYMIVGTFTHK